MHYLPSKRIMISAAKLMKISVEEYIQHRIAGEKRCRICKRWFDDLKSSACGTCRIPLRREANRKAANRRANKAEELVIDIPEEREERCDEPQPPTKNAWKRPDFLPCLSRPGSEVKVDTLAYRYANGLPLWHDDDAGNGKTERELAGNNPVIGEGSYGDVHGH